jgi:hypothetical protein
MRWAGHVVGIRETYLHCALEVRLARRRRREADGISKEVKKVKR